MPALRALLLAALAAEEESEGEYVLPAGVRVRVEIVAVDPAATMRLNGVALDTPGESGLLGTAPDIHGHPAWQLRVAEDAVGDYALTFRLTSDDARFAAAILSPRCALPTCHDAASAAGEMVLTDGQAWQALVGVPPVIDGAREAGMLRVDPGQPETSFLLVKLSGPPLGQGGRMPLGAAPLSAAEIATNVPPILSVPRTGGRDTSAVASGR